MKKIIKRIAVMLSALLIVTIIFVSKRYVPVLKAASSIKQLENGLYIMEFKGDYGFDDFLRYGAKSDKDVGDYLTSYLTFGLSQNDFNTKIDSFGCSTIYTQDKDGTYYFGRNFDWSKSQSMIVHTLPKNGYESLSTCCLDFLGFNNEYTPDASLMEKIESIAAIYVPLDGMNEKGLIVADLFAGDKQETHQQGGKTALTTTTAIRLLLDNAANVDEAIALLKQYDMHSSNQMSHHLSIADANGNSVVVEYIDNIMQVTKTNIVTNHYLSDSYKYGVGSKQSHLRYDILAAHTGKTNAIDVKNLLESVAQKNFPQTLDTHEKTMWSIVYCPKEHYANFYFVENFTHGYKLSLLEKNSFLSRNK